jgi:carbonic anhydrase
MCRCCKPETGRRGLLAAGLGALAMTQFAAPAGAQAPPRAAADPAAAFARLAAGNGRYVANKPKARDVSPGRALRASGQAPYAAVLGCADSRVAPELVFDEAPGNLFVVRVAGNFVTTEGLASLEFGAAVLGTKAILVLGHTSCGAVDATVQALQKGNDLPGSIAGLVNAMKPGIEPALRQTGGDLTRRALEANVRHSVQVLRTSSPLLSPLIQSGALAVRGGIYELPTGRVTML